MKRNALFYDKIAIKIQPADPNAMIIHIGLCTNECLNRDNGVRVNVSS